MNQQHTAELGNEDALLNGSRSEADLDDTSVASDGMRLSRIEEYELESLRKEDSLEACLGGINGGLMKLAFRSEQAILKSMEAAEGSILELPTLQRAMATHLSLTRQVDRYANLEARLAELRQQAETAELQHLFGAEERAVGGNKRPR